MMRFEWRNPPLWPRMPDKTKPAEAGFVYLNAC
jgi:hypothetical protein